VEGIRLSCWGRRNDDRMDTRDCQPAVRTPAVEYHAWRAGTLKGLPFLSALGRLPYGEGRQEAADTATAAGSDPLVGVEDSRCDGGRRPCYVRQGLGVVAKAPRSECCSLQCLPPSFALCTRKMRLDVGRDSDVVIQRGSAKNKSGKWLAALTHED
jgi:hypothetical protein